MGEIEEALRQLRSPGVLCFVRLWGTNQGICGELSFNSAEMVSQSGALEIVLREATIELTAEPAVLESLSWNEDFIETAETLVSTVERTEGATHASSRNETADLEAKLAGKGSAKIPFASAEIGTDIRDTNKTEQKSDRSRSQQTRYTQDIRHIRVERRAAAFRLGFRAHQREDLSELNTRLTRLPLLDTPVPSALNFERINLALLLSYDTDGEALRHAFSIRKATGAWRGLVENPNRKALAELLLSKFIPELHASQRIFPRGVEE